MVARFRSTERAVPQPALILAAALSNVLAHRDYWSIMALALSIPPLEDGGAPRPSFWLEAFTPSSAALAASSPGEQQSTVRYGPGHFSR